MKSIYDAQYKLLIQKLRQRRLETGFTQTQLAKKVGVDQTFVSKYEQCQRRLDVIELQRICKALGLSVSEFMGQFEKELRKEKNSKPVKNK
jgi:transcriptional regulator with XRE-family HTH domain